MNSSNDVKTLKINGSFNVAITQTSQGYLGIVDAYPIVVEAADLNSLAISLSKALSVYCLVYPKEAQQLIQISDLTI